MPVMLWESVVNKNRARSRMGSGRLRRWTATTTACMAVVLLFCWIGCFVVNGKEIKGNIGRVISRRGRLYTARSSCRLDAAIQQTSRRRSPEATLSSTTYPSPFSKVLPKEKVTCASTESLRQAIVSVVDEAWHNVQQCLPPEVLTAHEMEWKGVTSLLAMASLSQGSRESLSTRAALQSLVGVPLGDRRRAASDAPMADWYHGLLAHTALYRDPAHSMGLDSESYRTTHSRESPVTRDEASFVPRLAMVLDGAISTLRMVGRITTDPAVLLAAYVAGGLYGKDVDTQLVAALLSRLPSLTRTLVLQGVAMETASLSSPPRSNRRSNNESSLETEQEAEARTDGALFRPLPSTTRLVPPSLSTAAAVASTVAPTMILHTTPPPSASMDNDDDEHAVSAFQETLLHHAQQFCPYDKALFSIAMSLRAVRLQQLNPVGVEMPARWDTALYRSDADHCRRSSILLPPRRRRQQQQQRRRRRWLPPAVRHRLALDTLQLWAPLSFRLALAKVAPELEWHAYGLLFPASFDAFVRWYQAFLPAGHQVMHAFRQAVESALRHDPTVVLDDGRTTIDLTRVCRRVTIQARVKSPASTFKKMLFRGRGGGGDGRSQQEPVWDLIGVRIVVSLRPPRTLSSLEAGAGGGGGVTGEGAGPVAEEVETVEEEEEEEEPFAIDFDDGTADSTTATATAMAQMTMPPPEAVSPEVEAAVLRALHRRLQRLPQWWEDRPRVKDYIQQPKASGYQSLHTSMVQVETGHRVELQIRSARMHWEAEHGRASHNAYKVLGVPSTQQLLLAPERGHRSLRLSHRDRSQ